MRLRKIFNHPKVLLDFDNRRKQKLRMNDPDNDYENNSDSDSENDTECDDEDDNDNDSKNSEALSTTLPSDGIIKHEWWTSLCSENELNAIESSGKMLALFTIINECEALGDKLLVFSCCLSTLNVIEAFLAEVHKEKDPKATSSGFKGSWTRDIDYFRLDGTKSIEARNKA